MNSFKLRLLTVAAFLFIVPSLGSAQTPEQVLSNPAMLRELRARIMSSGLTPDQKAIPRIFSTPTSALARVPLTQHLLLFRRHPKMFSPLSLLLELSILSM
jgi:hypothetical protein